MSAELDRLREQIDHLNDRILENLNERAKLARAIGTLKAGQAYRPEREAQVLRRIKERNPGPLGAETVALLFREIMSACLALERPITVTRFSISWRLPFHSSVAVSARSGSGDGV